MSRTDRMLRVKPSCHCLRLETLFSGPKPELPSDRVLLNRPRRDWKGSEEMHWASAARDCAWCNEKGYRR